MSLKLQDSTNIGIEIEICMKKDFYKSLQTTKKIFTKVYKYPEGQDPFRKNYPEKSSPIPTLEELAENSSIESSPKSRKSKGNLFLYV